MTHFLKQIVTALTGLLSGIFIIYGLSQASMTQAQSNISCELVNNQEQMLVFFAPIEAQSQIRDILLNGEPYTNIGFSNGFFHIEYGEGERGWVRFHTRVMNGACPEFLENPPDDLTPLWQFPTLCLFTTNQTLAGYSDPLFKEPHLGFAGIPAGTYAIVEQQGDSIQLNGTSDMSGPYVSLTGGQLGGYCEGTMQLAIVLENTRMWTHPNVTKGDIIAPIPAGVEVPIISGPEDGIIQAGTTVSGDWFEVRHLDMQGWVWVDRLQFGRKFTTPQPVISTASTGDNARLWSEPNAKSGVIITAIPASTDVAIIGEPQMGFIQLDSDLTGNWYPVQFGGTVGWLYEARINFP